jgi:ABC-type lipoprotein release transport system permease subunit
MEKWIERQRHLIDFTLSSLFRRKRKNAALVFVYALVVFLLASVVFFVQSMKSESAAVLKDAPDMIVQRMVAGRYEMIPLAYLEPLRSIRGVSSVKARLWGYYYDPVVGANYTLMVSEDPEPGPGRIIVGEGVSRIRLANTGDTMEFRTYGGEIIDLEVQGTLSSESELVSSDLVLVTEQDFRRLFGVPDGFATDLAVRIRNSREIPTVALKAAGLLPDTRQVLKDELLRTYDAVFDWRGGILIVILSGAMMAFGILAWDKASGLSSEERREIGILKAIGWETSDVLLMKFWEGMAVSLTSFLMGVMLAYVHLYFASAALFEPVLKGWSVLYPRFRMTPSLDVFELSVLFFLSVVPYTVATIIPAWKAATSDPDTVMR